MGIVHPQMKHGCIGICRSEVYPVMKLVSAWAKIVFPQCLIAFLKVMLYVASSNPHLFTLLLAFFPLRNLASGLWSF